MLYKYTTGTGPNLVLLHGFGFNSEVWLETIEQLKKFFCITVFDLPGFGRSHPCHDIYDLQTVSKLIVAHAPTTAVYCGWSLGGMIAMQIAIDFPDRVKQLITVASTPKYLADEHWGGVTQTALTTFKQNIMNNFNATIQRFIISQFPATSCNKQYIRALKKITSKYNTPQTHALSSGINILQSIDLRQQLKQIPRQLHIIAEQDTMIPISITTRLQQLAPHAKQVVIKNAGHACFISHSSLFCQLLREHSYAHTSH